MFAVEYQKGRVVLRLVQLSEEPLIAELPLVFVQQDVKLGKLRRGVFDNQVPGGRRIEVVSTVEASGLLHHADEVFLLIIVLVVFIVILAVGLLTALTLWPPPLVGLSPLLVGRLTHCIWAYHYGSGLHRYLHGWWYCRIYHYYFRLGLDCLFHIEIN